MKLIFLVNVEYVVYVLG